MNFNEYQAETSKTAKYPPEHALVYLALGLASEAGEVAGKLKKIIRDNGFKIGPDQKSQLSSELGDVLWYIAQLALELDIPLGAVASSNVEKLRDRSERNVISGSGDNR